ncbi:gamma-glutamylcyclotransferase [Kaistia dalseonensis]|uniref:glutathione-specific gamma-glutamylcyclotransferase n=1 Tax=Kaistia dalseonensis TaxID=410840 RepID=A0ABU0H563_9HYPH|nr:gamma-glutamylcyclotransferase [Kaistia dalseonensis]MCX5494592.1 gamma-glutamylcyclotransferase [Kaistia dalseonensis]MDQ0437172.1 cation transport protein ChaC [Kaistia dalseonensis]
MSDFWVFGYGSLMWRPGFPYVETRPAHLHGEHRALCVLSFVHRGTREHPGLVLGLDRGGSCRGAAFRVADEDRDTVLAYLRERELVTNVYLEVERNIRLEGPERRYVKALTYVVDREHEQYAGMLSREAVLERVRDSVGVSGRNRDYVTATAEHLAGAGIRDSLLSWLAEELR